MKTYRIGVIGLGARAETFARQLNGRAEHGKLFGVCDLDADRMEKFCAYCDIDMKKIHTSTDPEAFVHQEEMDAIVIATPDFAHLEIAEMAFAAGKHVYLEKPLEVTVERCRQLLRAHRQSDVTAYVGFNLRVGAAQEKIKEICRSGILGQMIHIEGLEQTSSAHCSSFHRRFHRHVERSGGWLNTKSSHDMDIVQWFVGHEHKVVRVASFGGLNVLTPDKRPAERCAVCPEEVRAKCRYIDKAGFVFPVGGEEPIHHRDGTTYGADLCVYNDDKDIFDNQTLILEWDNGVRGNFNLQGFQYSGKRETKIWFEDGLLTHGIEAPVKIIRSDTGEVQTYAFQPRPGGHGGADPLMLGRFLNAIENGGATDSSLEAGYAATLVALKALESAQTGKVISIDPEEYEV